uniref:Uncharacterized protein LOC102804310 n=1 Tax=Saccoglossus kowalevskii TaxID=10224 RepID=A0ABM0LY17_SACKO|nr:PREDICTED: uncharacterized protein LOC102804310 [Saccoglossus kowalevskii]
MCKNQRGLDDKSLDALVEKYGKDKLLESMTEEERAEFEKMYQRVLCSDNYRGLKYMLERGCPVDMEFREAYGGMKFEVGEYLKETRIATITGSMTDPPFNPITPLAIVSICSEMDKEPKLLKLLIEYGLDLRKCKKSEYGEVSRERYRGVKNASALYCATVRCNTELVTMLLENGHPPEDELLYVLSTRRYLAHTPREKEILSLLIKHGCDVNARKGENGNTLAHMALALWFCYVEGLLKNCDDLDEGPFGGVQLTAKQWIFLNLEKMFLTNYIEFLGNHGFDFNGKNDRQQTLLHIFFKNVRMLKEIFPRPFLVVGHIIKDLLPMIVDKVDDVNTVDSDGKTVLDEFITGARKDLLVVYKPTNFEWLKTLIMKGACFSPIDYYDLIMIQ